MSVVERARRYLRVNGVAATAAQSVRFVYRKVRPGVTPVVLRRRELGRRLHATAGGRVLHGPLKGVRMGGNAGWGTADYGPMLLGMYEQHVTAALAGLAQHADTLVDIGAADGYFGVGLVAAGHFDRSICFEAHPIGRELLRANAEANGVADKVRIEGLADDGMLATLAAAGVDLARTVVLCDIEGAEFGVFTDTVLAGLAPATIVIELHDRLFPDGDARLAALKARAARHFTVGTIEPTQRDPHAFTELKGWPEDDKWLMCSEGRMVEQQWLLLTPRAASSQPH